MAPPPSSEQPTLNAAPKATASDGVSKRKQSKSRNGAFVVESLPASATSQCRTTVSEQAFVDAQV
jgi:hypothetical protein